MKNNQNPVRVLFLGASYGVVLGMRIAAAGHKVTFACREEEVRLINAGRLFLHVPAKESCRLAIGPSDCLYAPEARLPSEVNPVDYDLVCLAMQEPQYSADGVRQLIGKIARASVPCLSIMNMTLPPFLGKVTALPEHVSEQVFTEAALWRGLDPALFTMASTDPQAKRRDDSTGVVIDVTLPTNFKVAPFEHEEHQHILQRLAADIDASRIQREDELLQSRVRLCPHDSRFIPLSKWPTLITGNFRCMTEDAPVSIAEAVCADVNQSREIYEWVMDVCLTLGVEATVLVPFDRYRLAVEGLSLPSSLARGLYSGATAVERVDKLIQALARSHGMEHPLLNKIVEDVNDRIFSNRVGSVPADDDSQRNIRCAESKSQLLERSGAF